MANDLNRSIKIYIDNSDAQLKASQLEAKIQSLQASMEQLAATGQKDTAGYAQKQKAYNQATGSLEKYKQSVADTTRVLNNLSGATYNELSKVSKVIQIDLKGMARDTDEYRAKVQLLQTVEKERTAAMVAMRGESGKQQSVWSQMADGINKYSMMAMTGIAALAGITMKLNEYRQAALDLESSKANLKALTGLDDAGVNYLTDQAKKLSTSITEDGVRITQSAKDIEDGFTKMGSKRPELLKNKEALAEVTKEALTLAAAGKMQAEPAFEALAATMNQFSLGADQAKRAINVLGAGALAGSAEVSDLSDSLKNVGAVANGANMSLEQTVGALEVLAEKQLVGEEAGTKLRGAIIKMQAAGLGYASGSFVFRDALTELTSKLNGLHTEMERDALMHQTFGLENITAGKILVSNVAEYDKMTTAVTGTNVAIEQAVINTSTMSAKLAQAKNEMQLAGMQLADKLAPALYTLTSGSRDFMKALVVLVNWMGEHKTTILMTTTAIVAWTVAAKAHLIIEKLTSETVKSNIIVMNIRAAGIWLMTKANVAATESELALLAATKAANSAMKANIWGMVAVAVFTAVGYITDYLKKTKEVNALDDATSNIKKRISEQYDDQAAKVKSLIDILHNESNALTVRKDALEQLKKLAPDYHADLTEEGKLINDNTSALDAYLLNLEKKIKMDAYQDELTKALKAKVQMEKYAKPGYEASLTPEEKAYNEQHKITTGPFKNDTRGLDTYLQKSKEYVGILNEIKSLMDDIQGITPEETKPKEGDTKMIDGKSYTYKGGKWVLDSGGGSGGNDSDADKKAMQKKMDEIEAEKTAEETVLKEKYATGLIEKATYENQLYLIDQEAAMKRYKLYENDTAKQREEYNKMLDARIKYVNDMGKLDGQNFNRMTVDMKNTTKEAQKGLHQLSVTETKNQVSELQIRLKQIDIAERRELSNKDLTEREKSEIEKKYNQQRLVLTELTEEEKAKIYSDAFGALSQVLGQNTVAGKAAGIAQATIDTYVAANKALATYPPPFGAIAAAAAVVTGLENVKNILAVKTDIASNSASSGTSTSSSGARVLQNASGKYDVIGAADGKLYRNIPYVGSAQTGVVRQPTLIAEDGGEMVISSPDLSRLQRHINYPLVIEAINDARTNRVPQRSGGKYDVMQDNYQTRNVIDNAGTTFDPELKAMLASTNALLEHLKKNGVHTKFSFYQHDQARTIYDNSLIGGSRG